MRQLNVKFLLGLIGATILLSGSVFLLHRGQSGRIARALLRQAERAEQQGRPEQQVKYLARYLEFVPEDNAVRAELGRILASPEVAVSVRARERALFVLEQVLLREPDRHDSRRLLAQVALQLGRLKQAREHLDALAKQFPEDGEVARLLGQWHEARNDEREKDLDQAAAWYRKAIQWAPQQTDGYVRLAYLLRRRLDPDKNGPAAREADQVMDDLVARNPQSFRAYLARWRYRQECQTVPMEEAAPDVARALELAPDEADVLRAAAEAAQGKGNLDEARGHLRRGLELHPADGSLYQALARLEVQAHRRKEAIAGLRQGIKAVAPGQAQNDLLWTLANLLVDEGELPEAEGIIAQLRKARFAPAGADFLTARVLFKKGRWAEAARILERAGPLLQTEAELGRQADLLLGQCYERLDEPAGRRLAVYQRLAAREPGSASARQALAAALLTVGRLDEALEEYRKLTALPDAPAGAWTQAARLQLLRNLRREQPNWDEVEKALTQAEEKAPEDAEVVLLRSEVLRLKGRPDLARKRLEEARDRQPKKVEWWAALAALAERQGQPEEARRLLTEAQTHVGDTVDLRLAWARHWSARRDDEEARPALARLAEKLEQFEDADQARLLLGLAEARCRLGDFKEAERLWARVASQPRHANDLRMQQLWFDLALQAGEEETLRNVLDTIRRIEEGPGPLWHYGEALRLIRLARQGKREVLDEARAHLEAAAARRPSWAAVVLARAAVEDLKGNLEQAIAHYRRAIELGEDNPQATRELVHLLYRRKLFPEAEQEIRRLEKQAVLTPELQRLAADISLQNHDPVRAVRLATQAVSAESRDYRDYLWLGQVLAARGQASDEAEQNLRRATELGGDVPETWVALVRYLAFTNQVKEAEAAIAQARTKLPADQAPLALAQCDEALGRADLAQKHYQEALAARPKDITVLRSAAGFYLRAGRLAEAEPLLRSIVERKVQASDSDVAWARRTLAQALANLGDYRRFPEALALVGLRLEDETKLIEERKPAEAEAAEEQRVRARVLVTANRRPLRRQAIGFLEDLGQRRVLTPDDQFLLAQLYEAEGAWPKAREQFRSLIAGPAVDPLSLAHAARSFLRHNETDEASRCIGRLEQAEKTRQVGPGQFGSVELRAQLLEATGRPAEAVRLLQQYAEQPGAPPEGILLLAGCLARHDRLAEALDLCERAWANCPPEAVGGASVAALRAARASAEHTARVERMLRAAIAKHPDRVVLLLHLADVCDLQERYSDAEALYRQVLAKDAGNVVALNNLAWLLAQKPGGAAEALTLINRAVTLVGPRAELLDTRATVHLALNRSDLAIADLERSNAESPSGPRYFHLARAHLLANNAEAAAAAFRKAHASGLKPEQLHPVERVAFRKMLEQLR